MSFYFLLSQVFNLWIHLQLKNIFFFWNAGFKSPNQASSKWVLLLDSWTLGCQLQKGAARLWSEPMFVLVLIWVNSFRELTLLKVINTNTAYLPMHSVTEIRFLDVTGWVLFYIYHASAVEKTKNLPTAVNRNMINVYLQKWRCCMNPMKTVSPLEAGVF